MARNKNFCTATPELMVPLGSTGAGISAGTNTVLAAPGAGVSLVLTELFAMAASGAATIQIQAGTTNLSDAIPIGLASSLPQGFVLKWSDNPTILAPNTAFILKTTGTTVSGYVKYTVSNS